MKKRNITIRELKENLLDKSFSYQGMIFKKDIVPSIKPMMHRYIPSPLILNQKNRSSKEINKNFLKNKRHQSCHEVDIKATTSNIYTTCKKSSETIKPRNNFHKNFLLNSSKKFLEKEDEIVKNLSPNYNYKKMKRVDLLLKNNYVILSNSDISDISREDSDLSSLQEPKNGKNKDMENPIDNFCKYRLDKDIKGKIFNKRKEAKKYKENNSSSSSIESNIQNYNDICTRKNDVIKDCFKIKNEYYINISKMDEIDIFLNHQVSKSKIPIEGGINLIKNTNSILKMLQLGYCANKVSTDCASLIDQNDSPNTLNNYPKEGIYVKSSSNDENGRHS